MMLHYVTIGEEGHPTVAVLHGILGSCLNWRSFCQRLHRLRPELRFVLIDLRNHGRSPQIDPPNGLRNCADDIQHLQEQIGPITAIVGHSFGGKVALQCADSFGDALKEIWVLDSNPGLLSSSPKDRHEVAQVLSVLNSVKLPVAKRQHIIAQLLELGATSLIARWMTTNLKKNEAGTGYVWRFHLAGVEEMIEDYFQQDLWHVLEQPTRRCHIVRALQSDRWTKTDIQRLENLSDGYHCIDAGHWVHSDNPEDLMDLLMRNLLQE